MDRDQLLANLQDTAVIAAVVVANLSREYAHLLFNPTGNEIFDNFDLGVITGKVAGICEVMNSITDSTVDYSTVLANAVQEYIDNEQ